MYRCNRRRDTRRGLGSSAIVLNWISSSPEALIKDGIYWKRKTMLQSGLCFQNFCPDVSLFIRLLSWSHRVAYSKSSKAIGRDQSRRCFVLSHAFVGDKSRLVLVNTVFLLIPPLEARISNNPPRGRVIRRGFIGMETLH